MGPSIGIQIDNVHKRLGTTQALAGVSTLFEATRLHGLIGPEGAGKTTLLRSVVGLLRPDSGEVRFTDQGLPISFDRVRPGMAYMPQQQSLYPDLSIDEHLKFFQKLYGVPEQLYVERSTELLRITRLDKFRDRPAGKLSGGMYKKLGLMCALLQSPSVILLDEPTNGVDPISRREFWELLYSLSEGQILIIVATAYMDEAERCDQVHLLDRGRIIAHGEPRVLIEREGVSGFDELFIRREREGHS